MPDVSDTDKKLIAAVGKGDNQAFGFLFERYSKAVLGYTCRMLAGDRPVAEDVSQMVWEKVVARARDFSGSAFKAWLFTIVRNTVLDELRRRGRWKSDQIPDDATDEAQAVKLADELDALANTITAEQLLIRFAEHSELRRRIDLLPDRQRIALLSWLENELSQKELAEQLGISLKNLEVTLVRARKAVLAKGGE